MSGSPCSLKAGLPQRKGVLLETTHVGGGGGPTGPAGLQDELVL